MCAYCRHLSRMASGAGAAHDLRGALQALADTSALEQRQGVGSPAAEASANRDAAQQAAAGAARSAL